jgi:lysophospholipase L1-like esterase
MADIHKTYKIMVLGDSISRGVLYDDAAGRYVRIPEMYVNLVQRDIRAEMVNAARFGNTTTRTRERFLQELQKNDPDVVVIELGGNDCDFDWDAIGRNPKQHHVPKTSVEEFRDSLTDMVRMTRDKGKKPVLINLPPLDPERYFQWVCRKDRERQKNILSWLGSVSKIYWWQERYSSAVAELSRLTKSLMIDIRGAFLEQADFREYLCEDGIHPNKKGHALMAGRILELINVKYAFIRA